MPLVGFAHGPGSVLLLKHYRNAGTNHLVSLYWVRIWYYSLSIENPLRDIHNREFIQLTLIPMMENRHSSWSYVASGYFC